MSSTPLHRTSGSHLPFVVAVISGTAAIIMALVAMPILSGGPL